MVVARFKNKNASISNKTIQYIKVRLREWIQEIITSEDAKEIPKTLRAYIQTHPDRLGMGAVAEGYCIKPSRMDVQEYY